MAAFSRGLDAPANPIHASLVAELLATGRARAVPTGILVAALVDALGIVIAEGVRASTVHTTADVTREAVARLWLNTSRNLIP